MLRGMKVIFSICLLLTISLQGVAQNLAQQLQEGDLLFCVSAQGNHITQVTNGVEGLAIDHVGIVHLSKDSVYVLKPIPMSFHDKTGKVTQFWKDYYARRGLQVPEGEPGSNPGDLSRSQKLRYLFRFF